MSNSRKSSSFLACLAIGLVPLWLASCAGNEGGGTGTAGSGSGSAGSGGSTLGPNIV